MTISYFDTPTNPGTIRISVEENRIKNGYIVLGHYFELYSEKDPFRQGIGFYVHSSTNFLYTLRNNSYWIGFDGSGPYHIVSVYTGTGFSLPDISTVVELCNSRLKDGKGPLKLELSYNQKPKYSGALFSPEMVFLFAHADTPAELEELIVSGENSALSSIESRTILDPEDRQKIIAALTLAQNFLLTHDNYMKEMMGIIRPSSTVPAH